MISKSITIALLALLFASISFSQQQSVSTSPRKLKNVTEFGCCGLDLELSLLAEALHEVPEARAYIIGYSGPVDQPGKLIRYLRYIESNFPDTIGTDSHPISVINGGYRDEFAIELWIVPKGANPPKPSPSITTKVFDYLVGPVLFDESDAFILEGGDEPPYLAFDLHCGLGSPLWEEFFRILEDDPKLKGHIKIYVGQHDRTRKAKRIEKFLRLYLKEHFSNQAEAITVDYGGRREWSKIEIWVMPKDGSNSRSSSKARNTRQWRKASNKGMHRSARSVAHMNWGLRSRAR